MNKKEIYEVPQFEVIELEAEQMLASSDTDQGSYTDPWV